MKFSVGDKVYCKAYGKGKCRKVDEGDDLLTYLFKFYDGTLIWMPKRMAEHNVKIRKAEATAN